MNYGCLDYSSSGPVDRGFSTDMCLSILDKKNIEHLRGKPKMEKCHTIWVRCHDMKRVS